MLNHTKMGVDLGRSVGSIAKEEKMNRPMRFWPSPAMVVALAALVVALTGAAVAAIPNPDGSVATCYRNANGKLRVIDVGAGEGCKSRETALALATASDGAVPAARATSTSAQSVPGDFIGTVIELDSEAAAEGGFDTADLHDNVVNNSRLTAPIDGTYLVSAEAQWQISGSGLRQITIVAPTLAQPQIASDRDEPVSGSNDMTQSVSGVTRLEAGDYVELVVNQNSGVARNSLADSNEYPFLSMVWLGP